MLLQPYLLDNLVRQRQADFQAEAAHYALVDEVLRAKKVTTAQRLQRQPRIVRTPTWSSRQFNPGTRTDMAA